MRTSFVRGGSYSVERKGKNKPLSCVGIWFILCSKVFGELYIELDVCGACVWHMVSLNLPAKKTRSKEKTEAMCA